MMVVINMKYKVMMVFVICNSPQPHYHCIVLNTGDRGKNLNHDRHSGNEESLVFYNFIFIYESLPRIASSILMNCYQWGSYLLFETPTKEPMELAVVSKFHHWRPHRGSKS